MTYSFSQINMFLQCRHAYKLSYIDKMPSVVGPAVEQGKWVHQQLEDFPNHDPEADVFVAKLVEYLDKTGDEIIQREQFIEFDIAGIPFRGVIDALTKLGYIFDYKITSVPSSYANKIGYQLPMYRLALGKGKPKYLLFKVAGKEREFKALLVQEAVLTDEVLERKVKYISRIVEMIELCKEDGVFPPSYQDCNRCFMKAHCPYVTL